MAAWKLPPRTTTVQASPSSEWILPGDVLLEIVARSDILTFVRCAAACKHLRRDILHRSFIRRFLTHAQQGRRQGSGGGVVPTRILTHLNVHDDENDDGPPPPPLSLVHPTTPAAASFFDRHLSSHMPRFASDLLGQTYKVVRSRGGLVLLRRRNFSSKRSHHNNLCVYDPVDGHRTFLSYPPGITPTNDDSFDSCALLTEADGIGCSFLLFCPRFVTRRNRSSTRSIKIHVVTSTCNGVWKPADAAMPMAMSDDNKDYFRSQDWLAMHRDAVILQGGVIHWLVRDRGLIVTYNVRTMEHGTINLPGTSMTTSKGQLHLESHDDRKLLCLLGAKGFHISVWRQLPSGDWPLEAVAIDTEEKLRALDPDISPGRPFQFATSTGSNAVLLRVNRCAADPVTSYRALFFFLDLETMEIRALPDSTADSMVMEINLPSRLPAMKIYS